MLKYTLIFVAFTSGSEVVSCRIVVILLSTALTGVLIYIPCLVVALKESDKKHQQEISELHPSQSILNTSSFREELKKMD